MEGHRARKNVEPLSRGDPFAEFKDAHGYYEVSDAYRENAGRVGDLFVDAKDGPIYVGLRTRLLGMRSTLVPVYL